MVQGRVSNAYKLYGITYAYAIRQNIAHKKMRIIAHAKLIQRYYYYLACRTQIARSKSIIPLEKLFEIIAMGIQESIFHAKNVHFYAKSISYHRRPPDTELGRPDVVVCCLFIFFLRLDRFFSLIELHLRLQKYKMWFQKKSKSGF